MTRTNRRTIGEVALAVAIMLWLINELAGAFWLIGFSVGWLVGSITQNESDKTPDKLQP